MSVYGLLEALGWPSERQQLTNLNWIMFVLRVPGHTGLFGSG